MAATSYQIMVLDPVQGLVQAVFDGASFYDLKYSRILNGIGAIAFTVPSTPANRQAFQLDSFIEVYRSDPNNPPLLIKEETYLARTFNRFRQGDEEKFVVGGYSLNHLMKRRLVDPSEDGASTDGYSRKSGAADLVIHDYCFQQMSIGASAARRFPFFTVNPVSNVGVPVSAQLRYTELYQEMYNLTIPGQVDFHIDRTTGPNTALTIAPMGFDHSAKTNYPISPWVGFDPNRGNLQNPNLILDRQDERTLVYGLGQGQGAQRAIYLQFSSGMNDSPYNRWETYQDVRTALKTDPIGIGATATSQLYKYQPKQKFTFELQGGEGGNIYRQDWEVGDLVTGIWEEVQLTLRIWGVDVQVSETGDTLMIDAHLPTNI